MAETPVNSERPTAARTAGHLLLVWIVGAALAPALGFATVGAVWVGGPGATLAVLLVGGLLSIAALAATGLVVRDVVPLCATARGLMGWAATVLVGGTLGALGGFAAWTTDEFDLGGADMRIALSGLPYAVVAAFFVPSRSVRLTSAVALAGTLAFTTYTLQEAGERDRLDSLLNRSGLAREERLLIEPPGGLEAEEGSGTLGPNEFRMHFTQGGEPGASPGFDYRVSRRADGDCPKDLPGRIGCRDAGGGVTVVTQRHDDGEVWEYVHLRRDGLLLTARTTEGMGVPQLRQALEKARPATDEELLDIVRG
ncbi:hypothetical protein AB0M39_20130 [Streptomyces sp. NPDC051907]|uniref:hypothetical protein n=1 Tax=Streptomyces sp. NPDC051907 TaxID=3155284 RepID=UPI0034222C22